MCSNFFKKKSFISTSSAKTKQLGALFARTLIKTPSQKKALVIGLQGELGSGKTTFVQGFARGLGIRDKILSPTFLIMKTYRIRDMKYLYHIDCYRIQNSKEMKLLGWNAILSNPSHILFIEWPERIRDILPKSFLLIRFHVLERTKRKIEICGCP